MKRRRSRPINPGALTISLLLAAVVFYILIPPLLEFWLIEPDPREPLRLARLGLFEALRLRAMNAFFGAWIFFFGAAIGSFLNVVAYRLPRGESVASHGSRCPYCQTPIEARDNIPVLGWLSLRGRCRACRLPISKRYPIVELIVGIIFLWLALVQLRSGGANLPEPQPFRWPGFAFAVMAPDWPLIWATAFFSILASMLLVWCLLDLDEAATPFSFVLFGWLIAVATAAFNETAYPVLWLSPRAGLLSNRPEWWRIETALAGLAAGAALGLASGVRLDARRRWAWLATCSVIGAVLGWQASYRSCWRSRWLTRPSGCLAGAAIDTSWRCSP